MSSEGFSSRDLAALELPGAPSSHQGWEKHAKVNGWEVREHRGRLVARLQGVLSGLFGLEPLVLWRR